MGSKNFTPKRWKNISYQLGCLAGLTVLPKVELSTLLSSSLWLPFEDFRVIMTWRCLCDAGSGNPEWRGICDFPTFDNVPSSRPRSNSSSKIITCSLRLPSPTVRFWKMPKWATSSSCFQVISRVIFEVSDYIDVLFNISTWPLMTYLNDCEVCLTSKGIQLY